MNVSVMGLGCGGPSRLGQTLGKAEAESVSIIRSALDAGINFFDTAEAYQTESLVGKALQDAERSDLVISTKKSIHAEMTPASVRESVEASLKRLQTDYIDIYNLHGLGPADYPRMRESILPTFLDLRHEGLIRFIGVSEMFNQDKTHQMLIDSLPDDPWDVTMVGFNLLNQTARETVFPHTQTRNVAVQVMFAVRRALSQPDRLKEAMTQLIKAGQVDASEVDMSNPLGFVCEESDATSLVEAAYRFCRYEPGVHVVLSGTGNPAHLQANIDALCRPPLPARVTDKLRHIFRNASDVTGQ